MKITKQLFGDMLCGLAEAPIKPGTIEEEGFVSAYFEINPNLETLEKIEDGKVIVEGKEIAKFTYRKGGDLIIGSRFYQDISRYATAVEAFVKDLRYLFNISSSD